MNRELAEHISLLAAPIYAAMLQRHIVASTELPAETLSEMRKHAIIQAHALWRETLDAKP